MNDFVAATSLLPSFALIAEKCLKWKEWAMNAFRALLPVPAMLILLSCTDGADAVAINDYGDSVPAALDLQSCELIAISELAAPSGKIRVAYNAAMLQGKIVKLQNGTKLRQRELLNFNNMHLVPWTPPGHPGEGVEQGFGVYEWMIPDSGPYAGKRLCMPVSMRRGTIPPL
jgi:hypothetical protein